LFCFQTSRLQARLDDKGNIILLKWQDRTKWFQPLIRKGFYFLDAALTKPFETYVYHLEAAIASLHASAKAFDTTNWKMIYFLYQQLYKIQPTAIIALNKAIALAYADNKESALKELKQIEGLENYYLYQTAIGEIYYELNDKDVAKTYYERALKLTTSRQERQLLIEKIQNCLQ